VAVSAITNCVSPLCAQIFKGALLTKQYDLAITQLFSGFREVLARRHATPERPEDLPLALGCTKKWADLSKPDQAICIIFMAVCNHNGPESTQIVLEEISDDTSPLATALKASATELVQTH